MPYPRRNIYIPEELYGEIRQAAEEDAALGESGSISEWIREACREKLERRAAKEPPTP